MKDNLISVKYDDWIEFKQQKQILDNYFGEDLNDSEEFIDEDDI